MDNTIKELQNVPTTAISDVLKGMQNMNPQIKPLKEKYKIAGQAYTVQLPVGDNLMLLRSLKEAQPGDILVVDVKGDTYRAIAGDFVVGMMKSLKLGGLVVDGVIRDLIDIKALDFPVFSKGTTVSSGTKNGPGDTNIPISVGGTPVNPGDIIVGDVDGVVVIPKEKAQNVLTKAKEKMLADDEREAKVGQSREAIIDYVNHMLNK